MRVRLLPYKQGSLSAMNLAISLGVLRLRVGLSGVATRLGFRPKDGDIIINWGSSAYPEHWVGRERGINEHVYVRGTIINRPEAVAKACDKLTTFDTLRGHVSIPEYALTPTLPEQWLAEGHRVYGRQTLTGHSGQGILIFNQGDTVKPCLLYTKNTKAKYEYRVHVVAGKIIDVQQKKKREGFEGGISGIRNHANGWVFCRDGVVLPPSVEQAALKAVQILGLDFGAVDVGYRVVDDMPFVYEVNTAPGLEGTTLERYTQAFREEYLT